VGQDGILRAGLLTRAVCADCQKLVKNCHTGECC
jgi:hypothetical protein